MLSSAETEKKDVAVILEDFLRFSLAGLDKVLGAAFAL